MRYGFWLILSMFLLWCANPASAHAVAEFTEPTVFTAAVIGFNPNSVLLRTDGGTILLPRALAQLDPPAAAAGTSVVVTVAPFSGRPLAANAWVVLIQTAYGVAALPVKACMHELTWPVAHVNDGFNQAVEGDLVALHAAAHALGKSTMDVRLANGEVAYVPLHTAMNLGTADHGMCASASAGWPVAALPRGTTYGVVVGRLGDDAVLQVLRGGRLIVQRVSMPGLLGMMGEPVAINSARVATWHGFLLHQAVSP